MNGQFVIDASVLIQAYVKEEQSDNVLAFLSGLETPGKLTLHVPEFCLLECTNVIWKHVRLHGMPVQQAKRAIQHLSQLPLTIQPAVEYLEAALMLGIQNGLAIYDALYLALAADLNIPLLTADVRQGEVAQANGILIKSPADLL